MGHSTQKPNTTMLTMRTMNVMTNDDDNTNTSAPLAEEEEESDCSMSMCSEEDEEESEDGEELDATSVYVSLFAVADRMERWYAGGARECPEDNVMRVEALLRREPPVTNVFETREAVDGPHVGGMEYPNDRFRRLAERLEAEKARPRVERARRLATSEDLRAQAEAIAQRIEYAMHALPALWAQHASCTL